MAKAKEEVKTPKSAVTKKIAQGKFGFDLQGLKKSKNLLKTATFKKQEWYPLSPAFQDALSIPGLAKGHINLLRGWSDTGKTTALIEAAIAVQKAGDLPVFIITEMKWSWEHAKQMGFEVETTVDDETGEITYDGNFIYVDRSSLNTIEDVANFIADLILMQTNGQIPVDMTFLWDSAGSIPCQQSYDSNKSNAMWDAGAMSTQFGNFIDQKIMVSRKDTSPYTNTLIVANKIRIEYPPKGSNPKVQPKMRNKAGETLFWDATLIITFGGILGPGTTKCKATKNGKEVLWAKVTKVSCDKNHITNITTSGRIVAVAEGFIRNLPGEMNKYKKENSHKWAEILGSTDFELIEEEEDDSTSSSEE